MSEFEKYRIIQDLLYISDVDAEVLVLGKTRRVNGQQGRRSEVSAWRFACDFDIIGDDLIDFLNREKFPYLHGFKERTTS